MKYLGVEEITTPKQQNNGTREFALPYKIRGKRVTLASYQSGYEGLTEIVTQDIR